MSTLEFTRALGFEGSINLRDLGGYSSQVGGKVAWRKLFRSGHFAFMAAPALAEIEALGVVQIHDFRSAGEQSEYPNPFSCIKQFSDYRMSLGSFAQFYEFATAEDLSPTKVRKMIEQVYITALESMTQELSRFLRTLSYCRQPVLFHCMAGKDRTGLAAASLLMALGVDDTVIVDDYLLTDRYGETDRVQAYLVQILSRNGAAAVNEMAAREYAMVRESYIVSFLKQRDARFGNARRYLQLGLGLTDDDLSRLQANFLVPTP